MRLPNLAELCVRLERGYLTQFDTHLSLVPSTVRHTVAHSCAQLVELAPVMAQNLPLMAGLVTAVVAK